MSEAGDVKPTLEEQLAEFRRAHPFVTLTASDRDWRYCKGGATAPVILVLGGALGHAEFNFAVVAALEERCKVIAPDYPPVRALDDVTMDLAALLDVEGAAQAHVVGGSFGGVIAQAFARRRPDRIASLVLSHTGAPSRAPGRKAAVGLLKLLPEKVLRAMFRRRVQVALQGADPFWMREFERSVSVITKEDLISRTMLAAEFSDRYGGEIGPQQPAYPVLVIDADDDPLFRAPARSALRRLYPDAQFHAFEGTGHIAALLRPEAYAAVILDFVGQADRQRAWS